MSATDLTYKSVGMENWKNLVKLFESKGGPDYCWCMVWRNMNGGASRSSKADKKASLKTYVDQNTPTGLLGCAGTESVAWCSIAPRDSYRNLTGVDSLSDVWSLVCFFIKREYRKQGQTAKLIRAAINYAKENGAKYVEAYPVDPDSPSYRFMGFKPVFKKMGFNFRHKAGKRRNVMILQL